MQTIATGDSLEFGIVYRSVRGGQHELTRRCGTRIHVRAVQRDLRTGRGRHRLFGCMRKSITAESFGRPKKRFKDRTRERGESNMSKNMEASGCMSRIPHQQLVAALDAPEPLLPLAAVPGEPGQLRDTSVAAALPKSSFSDDSSSWAAASRADSADSAWGGPHGLGLGPPQGSWDWFTSRDSIRVPSSLRPDEWRPNESPLGPQLNSPSISPPRSPGQPRSERLERLSLGRGASSSDPTHVRLSMRVSLQPEVQRSSQDFAAARQASMRARFTDTIR